MRIALVVLSVALLASFAFSATIYVPDNYPTIQDAMNAAAYGDTVVVRPGVYVENIVILGKGLTLRSEKGPEVTIIDGNRTGSTVYADHLSGPPPLVQGFTITNGSGTPSGYNTLGGGVYSCWANLTVTDCIIAGNRAKNGGGVYCGGDLTEIRNSLIIRNWAKVEGGGILGGTWSGKIVNTIIAWNRADDEGGAIHCTNGIPSINNCTIWHNYARGSGCGIAIRWGGPVSIKNTIIRDNWTKSQYTKQISTASYGSYTAEYSNIEGGSPGVGNIDADPLFVDQARGDLHLTWSSPCRNTGDNASVTELFDREGDPRIAQGSVDMGADEFHPHFYMVGGTKPGSPVQVKVIGEPNERVMLALSNKVVDPPIQTPHGDLYLKLPLLHTWNLAKTNADGITALNATIPTGWASGSEHPFQAIIGGWGVQGTLTNLMLVKVK